MARGAGGAGGRRLPAPGATRGPAAPPTGDRAWLPYLNPLSPLILFSKIPEKIEKRREG